MEKQNRRGALLEWIKTPTINISQLLPEEVGD